MSWISRHPLAALAALALVLRVAAAAATEVRPVFPAYYYTDAALTHSYAISALEDLRAGRAPIINGTLGARLQTSISLGIYRTFGPSPFLVKLFNAIMGALAVAAFSWALSVVFPRPAPLAAGFLMAVWPSHIFYTSQNLKEAPIALLAYAALGAALAAGFDANASLRRTAGFAFAAAAALLGAGYYRSHVLISLGTALLAGLAMTAGRRPRANVLITAAALVAGCALYPSASRALLGSMRSSLMSDADQDRTPSPLIPIIQDSAGSTRRPTSPEGISRFRAARLWADRNWAATHSGRTIGTQIYPDAEFKTWLDVLLYLPKGSFTVLFMPLPVVSALEGKIGRLAAAGENLVLLLIAGLGLAGAARGPKTPARLVLLVFFAGMTAAAALFEFDLGSAGRHKLLYLSMLFPFAAEEALRRFRPGAPA